MKETNGYTIPAGTSVVTRNVHRDLRMRDHITRKELQFSNPKMTGDGGLLYYFELGDWLICVDADDVDSVQSDAILESDQTVSYGWLFNSDQ